MTSALRALLAREVVVEEESELELCRVHEGDNKAVLI